MPVLSTQRSIAIGTINRVRLHVVFNHTKCCGIVSAFLKIESIGELWGATCQSNFRVLQPWP